jgi:putative ABC transport system permease protein
VSVAAEYRYVVRGLLRRPAFTVIAAGTLALAIGGTTMLFSIVDGVLLRPLPLPAADRVCVLWGTAKGDTESVSAPDYLDWQRQSRGFDRLAAVRAENFNLTGEGEPEKLRGARASSSFLTLFGVRPLFGRAFLPAEDSPGAAGVVVLGHAFWQRRFGADPGAVGRSLRLNDAAYTIVGVMPAAFAIPGRDEQLWIPLALGQEALSLRARRNLTVFGRLAPGESLAAAAADLRTIAQRLEREYPETNTGHGAAVVSLREEIVGKVRPALLILFCAVVVLFVNACANVANLALVRTTGRERELAIRTAMGAGRLHVVWLLLAESFTLAALAAVGGAAIGAAGLRLFRALAAAKVPRLEAVHVDATALLFTVAMAGVAALICGLGPALFGRGDLAQALRGGRSARIGSHRLEAALAVAQVGLAMALLIGAGLLIRSYAGLQAVDLGFAPSRLLTFRLSLPARKYQAPGAAARAYQEVVAGLAALPGVRAASAASHIPLTGALESGIVVDGRPAPTSASDLAAAQLRVVDPGYFDTMRIRLIRGRLLAPADDERGRPVAVVNRTMARRFWADGNPVDKRIAYDFDGDFKTGIKPSWIEVVGVVGDVRHFGLASEPSPEVYIPMAQAGVTWSWFNRSMSLVARTDRDPDALAGAARATVWSVDRNLPVQDLGSVEDLLQRSVVQPRMNMLLLAIFAGMALVLAALGVYGLLSQLVQERTQEIGLRMCLGADRGSVVRLVVRRGMRLVLIGLGAGALAAMAATRLMSSLLFGVSALDLVTFCGAPLFLCLFAVLACYLPAKRASRLEPVRALQAD